VKIAPLTTTALATFSLTTDRSGAVDTGTNEQLRLVVKPQKKCQSAGDGYAPRRAYAQST
jgi:hypothetical protein